MLGIFDQDKIALLPRWLYFLRKLVSPAPQIKGRKTKNKPKPKLTTRDFRFVTLLLKEF